MQIIGKCTNQSKGNTESVQQWMHAVSICCHATLVTVSKAVSKADRGPCMVDERMKHGGMVQLVLGHRQFQGLDSR